MSYLHALLLGAALSVAPVLPALAAPVPATTPGLILAADAGNPYNSPTRRANPNSRQGTVPATPALQGPSTAPTPRPPTLDNRGIGNGENLRREQQAPRLEPTRPPRDATRVP